MKWQDDALAQMSILSGWKNSSAILDPEPCAEILPPSHGHPLPLGTSPTTFLPFERTFLPLSQPNNTGKFLLCVCTFKYPRDILLLAYIYCDSWYPPMFVECPMCTCDCFKALDVLVHLILCERTGHLYLKQDLSWIYHFFFFEQSWAFVGALEDTQLRGW